MPRRRILLLLLCAAMILTLVGCGGAKQPSSSEATAAPAPAEAAPAGDPVSGVTYADAYMNYLTVYGALLDEVTRRLETHNAILESRYPDSYYMNSNYLMLVYAPFNTAYPGLGSGMAEDNVAAAQEVLRGSFPDALLNRTAPGCWEASYTYVDKTSGEAVDRKGRCVWECDGQRGSFRVRAWVDDALVEFTEFIPQGGDRYLIYTRTDRALVEYANGKLTGLWHAHRISDPPLGAFPGDMRLYTLEQYDPFPAQSYTAEDFLAMDQGDDVQYTLVLENDNMTYTGKIPQDRLDPQGWKIGVGWIAIEPITLLK